MNKKEYKEWLRAVLKEVGQRYMELQDTEHFDDSDVPGGNEVYLSMTIIGTRPDDVAIMVGNGVREDGHGIEIFDHIQDPAQPILFEVECEEVTNE